MCDSSAFDKGVVLVDVMIREVHVYLLSLRLLAKQRVVSVL